MRDSIRQGGIISVIEYAALIDQILKELKRKGLAQKTNGKRTIDSFPSMDDVYLIHHDLEALQTMLQCDQPHRAQIPYTVRSSIMQSNKEREDK